MNLFDLLEWTGRTTLAVLAIALVLWVHQRRLSAASQYSVWRWVGGLVLASFVLMPLLPEWSVIPRFWATETAAPLPGLDATSEVLQAKVERSGPGESEGPMASTVVKIAIPWWVLVWVGVSSVLLVRLGLSFRFLSRLRTSFPEGHPASETTRSLTSSLGICKSIQIVSHAGSPMTWGFFRSAISLSSDCADWDGKRLELALRHELAHIIRRDPHWLLVSQVVLSLFWFHPGLWIIANRMRDARERAADEMVIGQGVSPADYAEVILSFLGPSSTRGAAVALCGIIASGSRKSVNRRITSVLNRSNARPRAIALFTQGLLLLSAIGIVSASVTANTALDIKTIVILDAGHGGHDTGAKAALGVEKDYNLDVTLRVETFLKERGIDCRLTRREDSYLSFAERRKVVPPDQDSIFVSIHHNSSSNDETGGIETYHVEGKSKAALGAKGLAENLLEASLRETGAKGRGVRASRNSLLREALVPSVLIECGFLTHKEEAKKIDSEAYRRKIARGIAFGILDYLSETGKKSTFVYDVEPLATPNPESIPPADGFDYPVGAPDGNGYYVYRGFKSGGHLGDDWNGLKGGNADQGDPVYSVANGVVVFSGDVKRGWGNVVILRHRYVEMNGEVTMVDSLYGHLHERSVSVGDVVNRGEAIGSIGRGPHNMYSAHLHFEIRKNLEIGMDRPLFAKSFENYHSPRTFISARRP